MSCAHELWERESAVVTEGLCPLCLHSMWQLAERRLAGSEAARDGLILLIQRYKSTLDEYAKSEIYGDRAREALSLTPRI